MCIRDRTKGPGGGGGGGGAGGRGGDWARAPIEPDLVARPGYTILYRGGTSPLQGRYYSDEKAFADNYVRRSSYGSNTRLWSVQIPDKTFARLDRATIKRGTGHGVIVSSRVARTARRIKSSDINEPK